MAKKKPSKKPTTPKVPTLPKEYQGLPTKVQARLLPLNTKERLFVIAYCGKARGNATLASQLAGVGQTYATNASQGSMLLQSPPVRAAIDAWMDAFAVSAAQVTAGIADLAQANVGPFLEYNVGTQQLTVKVPDAETWESHKHWVKSVRADAETGRVVHLEVHDALAARRELAKILKLYSDAPIFHFHLHLQQMTDDELLAQLAQAHEQAVGERPAQAIPLLPANEVRGG